MLSQPLFRLRSVSPVLVLCAAVHAIVAAETSAPAAPPAPGSMPPPAAVASEPLRSGVFEWEKMKVMPTPVGERRDVCNAPTPTLGNLRVHVTTLRPGMTSHAPHRHPEEEVLVVKEGVLEVFINGTTYRATAGAVVFFASNDLHGIRNVGETPATVHVIRPTPALPAAAPAK